MNRTDVYTWCVFHQWREETPLTTTRVNIPLPTPHMEYAFAIPNRPKQLRVCVTKLSISLREHTLA